jgi:HflK protein
MFSVVFDLVKEIFALYYESAIYILFGFSLAGLIRLFFKTSTIQKYLGKDRYKAIFRSSLLGIPLPLCSCSVLPTAISFRKSGASKGATASFLISTPEVGLDSIFLTYGLMGGVMAVLRPMASFFTAITAGFLIEFAERGKEEDPDAGEKDATGDPVSHEDTNSPGATDTSIGEFPNMSRNDFKSLWQKSFGYIFGDFFNEISWWLMLGFVISGIITVIIPDAVFTRFLSGNLALFVMLVAGIPMYVCASASTPIAAAMLLKGLSPGAAIVFLLAGPATNLGSIMILKKFLGSRSLFIYLAAIGVMTLFFGFVVNVHFPGDSFPLKIIENPIETAQFSYIKLGAAILLLGFFFRSFLTSPIPDEWHRYYDSLYRFARFSNDYLYHHTRFKFTQYNVILLIFVSLLITYLSTMFLIVEPGQMGFVRQFGKIQRENLPPGIHLHFPLPIARGEAYPVQEVRRINIGFEETDQKSGTATPVKRGVYQEALYITGDENIIDLNFVIQYDIRPDMAAGSIYLVSDLDSIIKSIAIKNMIRTIGTYQIDDVYSTERLTVEQTVKSLVQQQLDRLDIGVRILQVSLVYVHAPGRVHFNFRDVASAQEDRNRSINLAEVYATEKINLARGTGHRIIQDAHSYSSGLTNLSRGESQSFESQRQGYLLAPEVTRFRLYVETLETVLPGIRKYVKPPKGRIENLDLYMLAPNFLTGQTIYVDEKEKEDQRP